jgi:hypothetical protein
MGRSRSNHQAIKAITAGEQTERRFIARSMIFKSIRPLWAGDLQWDFTVGDFDRAAARAYSTPPMLLIARANIAGRCWPNLRTSLDLHVRVALGGRQRSFAATSHLRVGSAFAFWRRVRRGGVVVHRNRSPPANRCGPQKPVRAIADDSHADQTRVGPHR